MTGVAFLWHMHQPYYEDLVTREHILPWVRLHALKDYWGMVALLEEFPGVRATFNLVPSLLVQLEAFAAGQAHDRYLDLSLKPAESLDAADVAFVLRNFFSAHQPRMIDPFPRYAELLALRGPIVAPSDLAHAARRFSVADLRDLQVWQKLAWIDPAYQAGDARVRGLLERGRDFTEADKATLRGVELELLNAVIPAYRRAADEGRIEISTSPFYHPILPLLCDTEVYKRTHPESPMPRHRFMHPEDAREQLERAAACHLRLFGKRPEGLWPSEGSVSDAMVPLAVQAGFRWMATDELILARSLGIGFTRDGGGHLEQPDRLYTPYRLAVSGGEIAIAFRDHSLSDVIGFEYAGWDPEAAAADFVARLVEAGRRARAANGEEATIFVILDGENAWEYFPGGGRPFLRALYGRLSSHAELRTVTMSEACRAPRRSLTGVFPGSWIDANFYIWIGHADDRRAWGQLAEARDLLDGADKLPEKVRDQAREEILIAEGSDWFWWYGDDHSSPNDPEFDDLFRRHLRNVYRLVQRSAPDELFVTNISTAPHPASDVTEPTGFIHPRIDGEDSSYFEWLAAGEVQFRDVAGAMHRIDRPRRTLTGIKFGFDQDRLYLRVDTSAPAAGLLAAGYEIGVTFLAPEGIRVMCRRTGEATTATLGIRRPGTEDWAGRPFGGEAAAGSLLEVGVPLVDLPGHEGSSALSFVVTVTDPSGVEVEREPAQRPVRIERPSPDLEAKNWTA